MSESRDTSNTSVRAYVPAYQKAEWKDHADDLEMSLSEFIRTMVQAGRLGFETDHEEPDSPGATPGGNALGTQVLELLAADTYSWEELLEAVTADVESRLDDTLGELQSANRIRYSGRHGGYTLVEGEPNGD